MKPSTNENYLARSIKDGSYFKTGKQWFFEKYTSIYISKASLLLTLFIIFIIIATFIVSSVASVLIVNAKNGVVSLEGEFEDIFVLSKIPRYYNNNEKNILRFIAENYISNFESYNIDKFNIYQLNDKISQVKKYSSKSVGEKFEKIAKLNYIPEIFAGITREAHISSFNFIDEETGFIDNVLNYLFPINSPNKVRVEVVTDMYREMDRSRLKEEKNIIEMTFKYTPLKRNEKGEFDNLNFQVIGYNYMALNK